MKYLIISNLKNLIQSNGRVSQLRSSIFPNIPPFINFIKLKEQYDSSIKLDIPWNLWINCNNPLLLHTLIRAGFVRKQVNQVKLVVEKLDPKSNLKRNRN